MSSNKYCIEELRHFKQILIYGAGTAGRRAICEFRRNNFPKEQLIVWDENYKQIGSFCGYSVTKPQFEEFDDKDIPIIIAFSPRKNNAVACEIREKFANCGYQNFISLKDIPFSHEKSNIKLDDFNDEIKINRIYDCEYQDNIDFSKFHPKVKTLAYYLPQFHSIPENDKWLGDGFTEWTNTKKSVPYFEGHYQPREPHDDIGYYDLTDVETIRKQAQIAKQHGIYGWCIYYYWFSDKVILEKPINILLENKDIDINFCLSWINESWTKAWVGKTKEITLELKYSENDPENFIRDIEKYVADERYIRVDGKPLIMIYRPETVPDLRKTIALWREYARKRGVGELFIIINCRYFAPSLLGVEDCIDGATGFGFQVSLLNRLSENVINESDEKVFYNMINYSKYADAYLEFLKNDTDFVKYYRSCLAGFDNAARYKSNSEGFMTTNYYYSLRKYYEMAKANVDEACEMNKEFTFAYAWNEWAESAYLEPDKKYGYAVINTLSKAICGLPFEYGTDVTL